MKKICKVILAAAAIVALAVPAMAADKLIVKNAAGTADVFKVDDNGSFTGSGMTWDAVNKRLGINTSTPPNTMGVVKDTSVGSTIMMVDGYSGAAAANGANLAVRTSRGTEASPSPNLAGDNIGQVNFRGRATTAAWANARRSGIVSYATENYTSTGQGTNLTFVTTANGTTLPTEKLFVMGDGKIGIGSNDPKSMLHVVGLPVFADNAAATAGGLTAGAFYRTSTGNLMVCF